MATVENVSVGALLGDAGLTILTGLVVVFAVLVLLTEVFRLFGFIMKNLSAEEKSTEEEPVSAPASLQEAEIVGNTAPVSTAPEVQNGISAETVAAISGAVAAMAPAGTQYAVSAIHKK